MECRIKYYYFGNVFSEYFDTSSDCLNMTFVVNGNQMTVTTTNDGETETAIFTRQ